MGRTVEIELTDDEIAAFEREQRDGQDLVAWIQETIRAALAAAEQQRWIEGYRRFPQTEDELAVSRVALEAAAADIARELPWEPEVGRAR